MIVQQHDHATSQEIENYADSVNTTGGNRSDLTLSAALGQSSHKEKKKNAVSVNATDMVKG